MFMIRNSRNVAGQADNTYTNQTGSRFGKSIKENNMWTKPAATEMRFGFEVTMYVMNK
jgi:coenzyme PQQ precursor peptide PqqA